MTTTRTEQGTRPVPAMMATSASDSADTTSIPVPVPVPVPSSQAMSALGPKPRPTKAHVPSACVHCKKAHLACDLSRPCKRCFSVGKEDSCRDVEHKKRGRPKLVDKALKDKSRNESILTHTAALPPSRSLAPVIPPTPSSSPFYPHPLPSDSSQTKAPLDHYTPPKAAPPATLFLTLDLVCARVSDESHTLWGYHPHQVSLKSLYSIIHDKDHVKVARLLAQVKEDLLKSLPPLGPRTLDHMNLLPASSPVFYQNRPDIMSSSAPGSTEFTDVVNVSLASGSLDLFSIRIYVGGGLGTDLDRGANIEYSYLVCVMEWCASQDQAQHRDQSQDQGRHQVQDQVPPYSTQRGNSKSTSLSSTPITTTTTTSSGPSLDPKADHQRISLPPMAAGWHFPSPTSTKTPALPLPWSPYSYRGPSSSSSASTYTVPLGRPSTLPLPSLSSSGAGPLHTARWLFDPEPLGNRLDSRDPAHSSSAHRHPTHFSEPFGAVSAPMGGFGVSKYLGRSDQTFPHSTVRRHPLLLSSPSHLSRQDPVNTPPRSLRRDLSSLSSGASFGYSPSSIPGKRPLADMADSYDQTRDIDPRHQDHRRYQSTRTNTNPPTSATLPGSRSQPKAPYQSGTFRLELQTMPPDHPAVDNISTGVCPIVHGSRSQERIQPTQQSTPSPPATSLKGLDSSHHRGPCRWAAMSEQWTSTQGDSSGSIPPPSPEGQSSREHLAHDAGHGYLDQQRSFLIKDFALDLAQDSRNSLNTGLYPQKIGKATNDRGTMVCPRGACEGICRCCGMDEATRAAKAMDAARKRMSVHSLLC